MVITMPSVSSSEKDESLMEHRGILREDIHDSQLSTNNSVIYLFIEDIKKPSRHLPPILLNKVCLLSVFKTLKKTQDSFTQKLWVCTKKEFCTF